LQTGSSVCLSCESPTEKRCLSRITPRKVLAVRDGDCVTALKSARILTTNTST